MRIPALITMFLLCLGLENTVYSQTEPEKFFVKLITLETDPNPPGFLWSIANIALKKESNRKELTCIEGEFLKTGLISAVDSRITQIEGSTDYQLIFALKYESSNTNYLISKIELIDYDGVDESKFNELLASERLVGGSLSMKTGYKGLSDKIVELVKQSTKEESDLQYFTSPWLEVRLNRYKQLEVSVMPDFRGCDISDRFSTITRLEDH